jgi:hypothetical protein
MNLGTGLIPKYPEEKMKPHMLRYRGNITKVGENFFLEPCRGTYDNAFADQRHAPKYFAKLYTRVLIVGCEQTTPQKKK